MNIKINCQAFLDKKKIISVKNLQASINDYEIKETEVLGNIKIEGEGYINNLDEIMTIEELVPFSVILNDLLNNKTSNDLQIDIENFVYNVIDGRGLELEFDITVSLFENIEPILNIEEIDKLETSELTELKEVEVEPSLTPSNDELVDSSRKIVEIENEEDLASISNIDEEIDLNRNLADINNSDKSVETRVDEQVELKEEIVNKIDVMLSSKLSVKSDNFPDSKLPMRGLEDKTKKIKIVFYQNDNQLDEVIKKHNLSINTALAYRRIDQDERRRLIIHG